MGWSVDSLGVALAGLGMAFLRCGCGCTRGLPGEHARRAGKFQGDGGGCGAMRAVRGMMSGGERSDTIAFGLQACRKLARNQ